MMVAAGIGLLGVAAAVAPGGLGRPGGEALAALLPGQRVSAHFSVRRIYEGPDGQPRGGRFLHDNGLPVDVLLFPSAPRLSIYARTLPVSDRGEPHTGEHLLLGKGRTGHLLNALMEMRLGDHSAETHPELVCYHFRAAVGLPDFVDLTRAMLTALLRPDYSDEEIRREVAHMEAVPGAGGKLRLEEKGTVYNEMVSTTQDPNSVIWRQVHSLAYGRGHPLAREAGGLPAGIRALTPKAVRAFHAANYHLGPNMAVVAVVPSGWVVGEFLTRLEEVLAEVEPQPPRRRYARLPPARPVGTAQIKIGTFPSVDTSAPQGVVLSWRPLARRSLRDQYRLTLFLSVLAGGETSLLHRDLIDSQTRLLDTGATGIGYYLDDGPLPLPTLSLGGLRLAAIARPTLSELRARIEARIRWLHDLPEGSPDLAQIAERARSLLSSQRRGVSKALDDAPGFGQGNNAAGWHRYLDRLDQEAAGFRAPLLPEEIFRELERELDTGRNLWRGIAKEAGLLTRPQVSAARPDAARLTGERSAREARLHARTRELKSRLRREGEQAALAAFKREFDERTRAVETRNAEVTLPAFLREPPLVRDDAAFVQGELPGGIPVVRTHFDSSRFTDVGLALDLAAIPASDHELLPLLPTLDSLGVTTREGEVLDYASTEDRLRASVYGLGYGLAFSPRTGRAELQLAGSASSGAEITRLVDWMDTFLNRPRIDRSVRDRLMDVVRGRIKWLRSLFQGDPDTWAGQIASTIDYQNQPLYLATSSPFTTLYHLGRLYWRMVEPDSAEGRQQIGDLAAVEATVARGDRAALGRQVADLKGDLGEQLRFELDHLPPDSWQGDLTRLLREIRADLAAPPQALLDRLAALLARIRTRNGVRVQITGNTANADLAVQALGPLLAGLPAGPPRRLLPDGKNLAAPGTGPIYTRLRERYPGQQPIGPHLALVHDSASGAAQVIQTRGPDYRDANPESVLDLLAVGLLAGGGPSSLFMRTWAAGLAYSSGLAANPGGGRMSYIAHRCPDPVETLRFVGSFARSARVDADLVQASLANAFGDYAGSSGFSSRGARLASDLVDGLTPERVRTFKTRLLALAREPGTVETLARRLPEVLGRVLVGAGGKVSAGAGTVALLIAPARLIDRYQLFLEERGETTFLPRLYPRDFWPPEAR